MLAGNVMGKNSKVVALSGTAFNFGFNEKMYELANKIIKKISPFFEEESHFHNPTF
jgi:hypothetical protein